MSRSWSNGYVPLRIEPIPSPLVRRLFIAFPLLFFASPWLAGLPWPAAAVVSAIVTGASVALWRTRAELAGPPVRLRWDGDRRWYRETEEGELEMTLSGSSFVTPWLVVLNFRGDDGPFNLVLSPDSLDPQTFRRLRVRLTIEGLKVEEGSGG